MNYSCADPSCDNRAILILDANSVFYLIRGTARLVADRYSLPNRTARAFQIATELRRTFDLLRCCSISGNIHTSEAVFSEEISLAQRGNAIYEAVPELNGFTRKEQLGQIQNVLTSYLCPSLVTDQGQFVALRSFLRSYQLYPEDRDCTLILVACVNASYGIRTHLISNDYQVERSVRLLGECGTVNLSGTEMSLGLLNYLPYPLFLINSHDKCCLCSSRFGDLYDAYLSAAVERITDGLKKPRVEKRIAIGIDDALQIRTRSINRKMTTKLAE